MTVAELIEQLQKMPQDASVQIAIEKLWTGNIEVEYQVCTDSVVIFDYWTH